MIVSISQEYIFYNDKPPEKHNHRPYFLCRSDTDVPKLDKRVVEIGDIEQYDSWVNWGQKVNVRRIYINHPKSTPSVSNIYYKAGFENYENGVPYLQRVVSDLCAQGMWPLNTNNEKVILKCVIYDFEVVNGFINCCGIGQFNIAVTSSMNLDNEKFDIKFELLDKEPVVTQLLANSINEELNNILIPLIRIMKESHILIGHNILSFDNQELLNRLSEYKENNEVKDFINIYTYSHNAFYRGRISNSFEIYPISFDTLLASRFLFKDFAEGQYGLKVLAPLLDVDVTKYSSRSSEYNKRILERDFEGFGNWSNNNPLCLQYNRDDIYQTFGIFTKMFKEILTYMFITGMPFQEVVSGANTKIADYMTLIRCYKKKICPPVVEPIKVARALMYHFKGETPSKKEIFDFFRQHECNDSCLSGFKVQDNNNHLDIEVNNVLEETEESEDDIKHFDIMINKLYRCVRYGIEMPDYVEYYPLLLNYLSVGGMIFKPKISIQPLHNVFKADVSAQYPSILKAKNIVCDSVKLCRKDETPDGWCWFRNIGSTSILDKFNWKYADEPYVDKMDEYPKQYFIGYRQKGEEGVITKALTGIMEITSRYKKIPEWQDVYQRTLKPLRNSLTHGILLSLEATSMQYNIAGTAIPTYGQIITNKLVKEFNKAGWKLLEADSVHPNRNIPIINNGKLLVDRIGTIIDKAMSLSNLQYYTHNGVTREYLDLSNENIYTLSVSSDGKSRISKVLRYIRHKYKGKMLKIETPSGSTIVTPNHSLFTLVDKKLKVIDASMLKVSDGIVTLDHLPNLDQYINNQESYHINVPYQRVFPKHLTIDKKLSELLGYYVSEGWAGLHKRTSRDSYYVCISGADAKYINRVQSLCLELLKIHGIFQHIKDERGDITRYSYKLTMYGLPVYNLFTKYGCRSEEKRIDSLFFSSGYDSINSFLNAYIYGDGSVYFQKRLHDEDGVSSLFTKTLVKDVDTDYISTIKNDYHNVLRIQQTSEELSDQLSFILKLIGIKTTYASIAPRKGQNHIVHKLASSTKRNSDISKQNDIVLSYISKIEEIDYEGYVYDLEVDIDNNFIDATGVLLHNTDGAEFIKDVPDAKDFATVVAEVEDYWNKQFDYPISFDIEHHAHKVYLAHKNYVTIKDNKVKLTGATLHASDKPNIAENIMKKLMLEILPISNTKEEFLNNIRKYTTKIINAQFKDLKLRDLVMISSIKPPADYTSNNFRLRAEAIERVLNRTITFPTKIEFLVCKKPLPNVPANKTSSDPIAYMWPKEIVEEQNIEIDYEWYKNMIYTYIDSCFGLEKSSSRHSVKSLVGFDQENIVEEARKIPFKTYVKQKKLF